MDQSKFSLYISSAIRVLFGIAHYIAVIEYMATNQVNRSTTVNAISGALLRDCVNMIDSLVKDKYRDDGLIGITKAISKAVREGKATWLAHAFGDLAVELENCVKHRPKATLHKISALRRATTAHMPMYPDPTDNAIIPSIEELRGAYNVLYKAFEILMRSSLPSPAWPFDHTAIAAEALRVLSQPIVIAK